MLFEKEEYLDHVKSSKSCVVSSKGASTRSYFCTTLSSYKSTCTSYFYIVLVLLYDAKKKFCPNGHTQHIISVVYENQCASDFSVKG